MAARSRNLTDGKQELPLQFSLRGSVLWRKMGGGCSLGTTGRDSGSGQCGHAWTNSSSHVRAVIATPTSRLAFSLVKKGANDIDGHFDTLHTREPSNSRLSNTTTPGLFHSNAPSRPRLGPTPWRARFALESV